MQRVLRKELPLKQRWTDEKGNGKKLLLQQTYTCLKTQLFSPFKVCLTGKIHPVSIEVNHLCTCNPGQFSLLDDLEHF